MAGDEPDHPDAHRLQGFAAGTLAEPDLAQVADHLDGCAGCRARVDALLTRDDFLGRLRSAGLLAQTIVEDEPERRRAALALLREARNITHLGREREPAPDGAAPREVGEYSILREVGRGGMGSSTRPGIAACGGWWP